MANPEHLAKIATGVEQWNLWRTNRPSVVPDLSDADLRNSDLSDALLDYTNLRRANLRETSLRMAKLVGANLEVANLSRADLHGVDLSAADLRVANLSRANLREALLKGANLNLANLYRADLRGANILTGDLTRANCRSANFGKSLLVQANLSGADFTDANLTESDLSQAKLSMTNLCSARLQRATLDWAILTDAKLWETQRAGWSIKGVICERAYWDSKGVDALTYAPAEFERLYSEQTRIELFYQGGITTFELNTLPALLHRLATLHPQCSIRIRSMDETGGGAKVVFSVSEADAGSLEAIRIEAQQAHAAQLSLREDPRVQLEIAKGINSYLESLIPRLLEHGRAPDVHNVSNYYGPVANAAPHGHLISQTTNCGAQSSELLRLVAEMATHLGELALNGPERRNAEAQIATLNAQLAHEAPDPVIVQQAGRTLRNLTEGAIGSLVAAALQPTVWHWVQKTLASFT